MEGVNDSTDASRRWTNILNLSSGYLRGIKIIIKPIIAHTTKRSHPFNVFVHHHHQIVFSLLSDGFLIFLLRECVNLFQLSI